MSQQQNSSARSVTFNDEQTAAQQQDDSCRMKQMTELRESSAFIRRHPESLLFVACKVFQALDADNNSQISWPEIEVKSSSQNCFFFHYRFEPLAENK